MALPDPLFVRLRDRFTALLPEDTPDRANLAYKLASEARLEAQSDFDYLVGEADRQSAQLAATVAAGDILAREVERQTSMLDGEVTAWRVARVGGDPVVLQVEDDILVVARPGLRMFDSAAEKPRPPVMVLLPAWVADALAHLLGTFSAVHDALGAPDLDASPRPELAEALHLAHDLSEGRGPCSGWVYDGPLAERAAELLADR